MEQNVNQILLSEAAKKGVVLGVIFCAMFVMVFAQLYVPLLLLVLLAGIIIVPVLAYKWLRRWFVESGYSLRFPSLWLAGIVMFMCGSLIMAVGIYVVLKVFLPDLIPNLLNAMTEMAAVATDPVLKEQAAAVEQLVAETGVPRPIDVALQTAWSGIFTGTILTLILSGLIVSLKPRS